MIDEMTVKRLVLASPQQCHDLVADIDNYPNWASGLSELNVLKRDEDGRACEVSFKVRGFGLSAQCTLVYDYSQSPDRIAWHLVSGDIVSKLDGYYEFEAAPDHEGATMLKYNLALEIAIPLTGFFKRRAEARIAHAAIDDLQHQLESGPQEASPAESGPLKK